MRINKTIVIGVILLGVALLASKLYVGAQTGYVTVATDSSSQSAAINLRGDHAALQKITSSHSIVYKLSHGTYSLSITRAGFTPLITTFTVKTGDHLQINGHLNFIHDPTITSVSQIPQLSGNNYILDSVNYFEGKTWAVIKLRLPGTDPAFAIASYDITSGTWSLVNGPGTDFSSDDLRAVPNDVADYITNILGS